MSAIFLTGLSQTIPFLPLVLAIYVSFCVLNATDMTLDGSFVLGAGIFARLLEMNYSPVIALFLALICGALTGIGVAIIQRKQKIDSLLAGVLATFVLVSLNLLVMGRPNISLLEKTTLLSDMFSKSSLLGYSTAAIYCGIACIIVSVLLLTRLGLLLRAFGDNPQLLRQLGRNIENYRMFGFALTNCLAAFSGVLTAQIVGYADISMGFGVTLTALGTMILGRQLIKNAFLACLLGAFIYFSLMNTLLHLNVDPIFLKLILGILLIFFLRLAKDITLVGKSL